MWRSGCVLLQKLVLFLARSTGLALPFGSGPAYAGVRPKGLKAAEWKIISGCVHLQSPAQIGRGGQR